MKSKINTSVRPLGSCNEHKKNNLKIVSKNLIKLIIILFITINCRAQIIVDVSNFNIGNNIENNTGKYFKDLGNNYPKFIGTWENVTGNKTFRIVLWKIPREPMGSPVKYYADNFGGSFMIIQDAGTVNEVVLCNSVKYYPQSGYTSDRTFWCRTWDGVFLGGHMEDNCASGGNDTLTAFFSFIITNPGVTPAVAHWKVKPRELSVQGTYYSIPTDVMMTKVN